MKKKLIIVSLILAMIIGVGIYSYFSTKGEKNDVQQPVVIEDTSDSNNADETTSNGINVVVGTIEEDTNSSNNDVTENKETSNNNSGISFSIVKETTSKENKVKIKTTTKKTKVTRKKIKVKKRKITTYPSTNTKPIYNPTPTKKKATVTKPKQTVKPATKPLGTYYESNSLSSGKVSTIKNSIISKMSGSQDSEKMSLARYMSARGLSNGTSTYKSLTNGNKTFSTRVASKNIESDSNKNIIKAASILAKSAGGSGSYGIGISSFRNKVGYRIYVVIIH